MNSQTELHHKHAILFVDDEEQSLKYFDRAFSKQFNVKTASSAAEALKLLGDEKNDIGVLITDQRMPKQTGVDLLERVRKDYPSIVRILTTAYAELDNAIQAVNNGAVFRYVTKPWDLADLKGVLKTAMEFHVVQRERDALMAEKLSALHRVLVLDRFRSLAVIMGSFSRVFNHTECALYQYMTLANNLGIDLYPTNGMEWGDIWTAGPKQTHQVMNLAQSLSALLPAAIATEDVDVVGATDEVLSDLDTGHEVSVSAEVPSIVVSASPACLRTSIETIIDVLSHGVESVLTIKITQDSIGGVGAARMSIASSASVKLLHLFGATSPQSSNVSSDAALLAAFIVVYHCNGEIDIKASPEGGVIITLIWPKDPRSACVPLPPNDWIEQIFSRMEESID